MRCAKAYWGENTSTAISVVLQSARLFFVPEPISRHVRLFDRLNRQLNPSRLFDSCVENRKNGQRLVCNSNIVLPHLQHSLDVVKHGFSQWDDGANSFCARRSETVLLFSPSTFLSSTATRQGLVCVCVCVCVIDTPQDMEQVQIFVTGARQRRIRLNDQQERS